MDRGKFPTRRRAGRGFPHRGIPATLCLLAFASIASSAGAAQAPIIDSFTASPPQVAPGEVATFTVEAHDPDCSGTCTSGCGLYVRADLTSWTASGGSFVAENDGDSGSPYTASADWQAPAEEGTYTVTVSLSDSGSFLCGGRKTTTQQREILVTTSTGEPPVIESLSAAPTQLFPDETSQLTCVASDPEGGAVTYSWQADFGTVVPGTGGSAEFSAPQPGLATVTCTATDPDGSFASDSVVLSVSGARAETSIGAGLTSPRRLAVDSRGDVFVVDGAGLTVVNLFSGELVYRLPVPGARSVAVDWNDNLLLGTVAGARVVDRRGNALLVLDPGSGAGEVSDVAVDHLNRRYGVLHRSSGRVVHYDAAGAKTGEFGSTGDGPAQLRGPLGLAATPAGEWVVADSGHGLIKRFDAAGSLLASFGGSGGGGGEFVRLDDVAVDAAGVVFASDSFQSWVQAFDPDGSLREVLGTYGSEVGQLATAAGVAPVGVFDRLLVASLNGSRLEVFTTSGTPAGPGPAPLPALSAASLAFPDQAVGTTSAPLSLVLSNGGDGLLGVRGVTVEGGFRQTSDCLPLVEPGGECTLTIVFEPAATGPESGELRVDTSGGELVAALSGSGFLPPAIRLEPASLSFPDQRVGTVSPSRAARLTNTGTVPLSIADIQLAGEFGQTNDCGGVVAGGASCDLSVVFSPVTVDDELAGAITIVSNAAAGSSVLPLLGAGVPVPLELQVADQSLEEGDEGTTDLVFELALSAPATSTVQADYAAVPESATEGEDFAPVAGTVSIPAGASIATVAVPVLGDRMLEPAEETFRLELSRPFNVSLAVSSVVGRILDDEVCLGPNLLANPGAEEWQSVAGDVPRWEEGPGTSATRRKLDPEPQAGRAYFSSQSVVGTSVLTQDVDLSPYRDAIAAGEQSFAFDGWVRTVPSHAGDTVRVEVEYRDDLNAVVLDSFDSGQLVSAQEWLQVVDVRTAPPGAGWARVRLTATWPGEMDPAPSGFFDELSLRSARAAAVTLEPMAAYEGDVGTSEGTFRVRLACPYYREVALDFATADGTAGQGVDYASTLGTLTLTPGVEVLEVPVTIFGDEEPEGHETVRLDLLLTGGSGAVLAAPSTLGTLLDDDVCARGPGFWRSRMGAWPVEFLVIGDVEYGPEEILGLLGERPRICRGLCVEGVFQPARKVAPDKLARQVAAAKLNLAAGSDPVILPQVAAADALLVLWPPGTSGGDAREEILALAEELDLYNSGCDDGPPGFAWGEGTR